MSCKKQGNPELECRGLGCRKEEHPVQVIVDHWPEGARERKTPPKPSPVEEYGPA